MEEKRVRLDKQRHSSENWRRISVRRVGIRSSLGGWGTIAWIGLMMLFQNVRKNRHELENEGEFQKILYSFTDWRLYVHQCVNQ